MVSSENDERVALLGAGGGVAAASTSSASTASRRASQAHAVGSINGEPSSSSSSATPLPVMCVCVHVRDGLLVQHPTNAAAKAERAAVACGTLARNHAWDTEFHSYEISGFGLVHRYVHGGTLCVLCTTHEAYPRRAAFALLMEVAAAVAPRIAVDASNPFAITEDDVHEVIDALTPAFQTNKIERLAEIKSKAAAAHAAVRENLTAILERGLTIEQLCAVSGQLAATSESFRTTSAQLNSTMSRRNCLITFVVILLLVGIAVGILLGVCGVTFSNCQADS